MQKSPTILLGVCGGIAAYKSLEIASAFVQEGWDVYVAMTPSAQQFVQPLSFASIIQRSVLHTLFPGYAKKSLGDIYPHLYPATIADVCIIAPITANMIGKLSHGIADDIVSTSALSLSKECRRYFCPAMNVEMWQQNIVQENTQRIESQGWQRIGPEEGYLACGAIGSGRLASPKHIVNRILTENNNTICDGIHILLLSGPTIESIDPVRFISNHSSGKMGYALAHAVVASGGTVDMITGPVSSENIPKHSRINLFPIQSANEMFEKAKERFSYADIIISVAAIADFTPKNPSKKKLPKSAAGADIDLISTPDIVAYLGKRKQTNQVVIGFALENEENSVSRAKEKRKKKSLDAIILNTISSFQKDTGHFTFISRDDRIQSWGHIEKKACAYSIIHEVMLLLKDIRALPKQI